MTKNESCICTQGKIWELHIHSNRCFSADKELKKLSIPDYVTSLLEVLDGYEDLEMISFTDHNQICFDLYKEFINRDSRFVLLPGIEIDVCLFLNGEKKDSKHVVAYFDAADDIDKIEKLSKEINEFVAKNHIGVQKDG